MNLNTWRNRLAHRLANAALRLANDDYRRMIAGSITYGLAAAAKENDERLGGLPADVRGG